jgi:hypothetical protein
VKTSGSNVDVRKVIETINLIWYFLKTKHCIWIIKWFFFCFFII